MVIMNTGATGHSSPIEDPKDVKEGMALYIKWRINQLNAGRQVFNHKLKTGKISIVLKKDTIQDIKKELAGFGGLVLPVKPKKKPPRLVSVLLDQDNLRELVIDGELETTSGKIIGYYCLECLECAAVNERDYLFVQQFGIPYCIWCYGNNIEAIFEDDILESMGY